MRYEAFEENVIRKAPGYPSQAHMEETMREATRPATENRISLNDRLEPVFQDCSWEDGSVTLSFHSDPWMANTGGNMHGGMIATFCDLTMGVLSRYFKGSRACVTVHLSVEYARGVAPTGDVTVKAVMEKAGRNIYFLSARAYRSSDGKLAALATAEFM